MTNKVKYTNAPTDVDDALDDAHIVSDLLPSPAELVRKTEKEKVTMLLDKRSVELFRAYAKKRNAKYQSMINGVVTSYADKYLSRK